MPRRSRAGSVSLRAIYRRFSRISADSPRRISVSFRRLNAVARFALCVAIAGDGCSAWAATYTVTADSAMTFTPATITIYQYDKILFENAGGLHNVRADNNSFWCADDCSLHRSPSSSAWQDTVTFNALGTVGYYCEQHGDTTSGMRGAIIVIDRIFVDGFDSPPS
ncbi:MAG: plastocyanin/azurin family copper-binding protein [Rudaea sp.]